MLNEIDVYAVVINDIAHYNMVVALCPPLAEIEYESLTGHYFVLSEGPLKYCTVPPGALTDNDIETAAIDAQVYHLTRE